MPIEELAPGLSSFRCGNLYLVNNGDSTWNLARVFPVPYGYELTTQYDEPYWLEQTSIFAFGFRMDDFGELYGGRFIQAAGPAFE